MIVPPSTVNFFAPVIAQLQAVDTGSTSGCYATFHSTKSPVLLRSEDGYAYLWKHESSPVARRAEEGASKLAAFITGGLVPIAIQKVYRGNIGLIQNYIPNEISESFEVKKLTDEQISQLLAHMIADWVISNYDNHSRNYLMDTQGRVIGIDKGGSFKYFRGAVVYSTFSHELTEPATIYPEFYVDNAWPAYFPGTYPVYFTLFQELISRNDIGPVLNSQAVRAALLRCEELTHEHIEAWLGDYADLAFTDKKEAFLKDVLRRAKSIREAWELFCNKVEVLRYS